MKVLWIHNFSPQIPNAGNFMFILANGLKQLDVNIDMLYLGNLRKPRELMVAQREVVRKSKNYDLVHAQFGSACAFISSGAVVPKLVSLRGSDWHRYSGNNKFLTYHAIFSHFLTRISLRKFNSVITMSDRMKLEVQQICKHPNVVTVTDPVNTDLFRLQDRQLVRSQFCGTTDKAPWVLFTTLSKTNPIKRVDLAVEAIRIAQQNMKDLNIKIANGIPHEHMPLFVSACDVALCTSTHEGWPNSIKEALACGIPFVSTDVSDLHIIASRHPICKISAPNAESIAYNLCQIIKNGCVRNQQLRDEAMHMSIPSISNRLVAIYKHVLS